jgi:hypothetical protein
MVISASSPGSYVGRSPDRHVDPRRIERHGQADRAHPVLGGGLTPLPIGAGHAAHVRRAAAERHSITVAPDARCARFSISPPCSTVRSPSPACEIIRRPAHNGLVGREIHPAAALRHRRPVAVALSPGPERRAAALADPADP